MRKMSGKEKKMLVKNEMGVGSRRDGGAGILHSAHFASNLLNVKMSMSKCWKWAALCSSARVQARFFYCCLEVMR